MKYPSDETAEREVIASALFKKDCLYKLLETGDIFFNSENKTIFNAMQELYSMNESVDMSAVRAYLNNSDYDSYFADLATSSVLMNYEYIIKKLERLKYQRDLMSYSKDLYASCSNGDMIFQDFINEIIEINNKLNRPLESESCTMQEMTDKNLDDIFKVESYIKTGLYSLDDKIIGLFKGQLIVIAAAPGMGKTTLAWNLCCNINDTLFMSYEMQRSELYAKTLSRYSGVDSLKIESKNVHGSDLEKLLKAVDYIKKNIRVTLYDYPLPFYRLVSAIRMNCKQKDIKAVIIDYLQLVEGSQGDNKEERISNITRTLKLLAGELKIPVILLSQLTKDVLKDGRRPTLGDLRGSGAIGQDADLVLFLYENKELETCIDIGKARKGSLGAVTGIEFEKNYSRFKDIYDEIPETKHFYEQQKFDTSEA